MKVGTSSTASAKLAATCIVALSALCISWMPVYNGFPFLTHDSRPYFANGFRVFDVGFWEVQSQALRPIFYGVIAALLQPFGLWGPLILQNVLVATLLFLNFRLLAPRAPLGAFLFVVLGLCGMTAISITLGTLIPDAYTGSVFLAAIVILLSPAVRQIAFASCVLFVAVLQHLTHPPLAMALAAVGMMGASFRQTSYRRAMLIGAIALAPFALSFLGTGNAGKQVRNDYVYFMERLKNAGILHDYLISACPDTKILFCDVVDLVGRDGPNFAWGEASVLNQKQNVPYEDWKALYYGAIGMFPGRYALEVVRGGLNQLKAFDLTIPDGASTFQNVIKLRYRDQQSAFSLARQLQGKISPKIMELMSAAQRILTLVVMLGLVYFIARRRLVGREGLALALLLTFLVANAFICGGLGDTFHRYQARIVWLAPFFAALVALRIYGDRRVKDGSGSLLPGNRQDT